MVFPGQLGHHGFNCPIYTFCRIFLWSVWSSELVPYADALQKLPHCIAGKLTAIISYENLWGSEAG